MADPVAAATASIDAASTAASSATDVAERLTKAALSMGDILTQVAGQYAGVIATSTALGLAASAKSSELYKDYVKPFEQAALIPRLLVAELTGASVLGLSEISTTAKALRDQSYKEQQQMVGEQVNVGGEGAKAFILPLTSFYKDASDLGKTFIEGALGDSRLYSAGMRALSETNSLETKKISAFTAKGLGLEAHNMRAIYQEEFSKTGQITGDFVEKFSATVLAAEKVTGLSNRALADDMKRMVNDVDNFGNISNARMASLSSTIHQLGIDIVDVTSVAGKFASFDSATTAISNLSAVTGASLDTMELFYLANEDKEEFFKSLRQQLIDQGVSLEDLSHQEQVYLSKQLGFTSVRQLQSLMNEDIELTSENMSEMIENAAEGSEFQGKNLEDLLTKTAGFAKDTLAAMEPGALQGSLDAVKSLAGGTNEYAESIIKVNKNIATYATKAIPEFAAAGKVFATSVAESLNTSVKSIGAFKRFFEAFGESGGGAAGFTAGVTAATLPLQTRSMPPLWANVIKGLGLFRAEFIETLDSTAVGAADKIKALDKTVTGNMKGSIETTIKSFAELKEKLKAETVEIDKIEKQLAEDSKKIGSESGDLTKKFKDLTGYSERDREALLQKEFGGGEGQILTDENVTKLVAALEKKDLSAGSAAITEALNASAAAALAKATAAKATTPAVPTAPAGAAAVAPAAPATPAVAVQPTAPEVPPASAPAGTGATTAPGPAGAATAAGTTTASGDMAIRVKIDFDSGELGKLIEAQVKSVITNGTQIDSGNAGGRMAGTYTIALKDSVGNIT